MAQNFIFKYAVDHLGAKNLVDLGNDDNSDMILIFCAAGQKHEYT